MLLGSQGGKQARKLYQAFSASNAAVGGVAQIVYSFGLLDA